jgi:hypothetical protein
MGLEPARRGMELAKRMPTNGDTYRASGVTPRRDGDFDNGIESGK